MTKKAKRKPENSLPTENDKKLVSSGKKSGQLSRPERLLMILNLISGGRRADTAELAKRCGVSQRTIYRDITDIARANFPLYHERGYSLLDAERLPPLNITNAEFAVLQSVLEGWPLAKIDPYREPLNSLSAKLTRYYQQSIPTPQREKPPPVTLRPKSTGGSSLSSDHFPRLTTAINKHETLEILYESLADQPGRRQVDPYFLVFRGRAFYLVGFCHLREAFRIFRLDRIYQVSATGQIFSRDESVTFESLFRYSWDVYLGSPIKVRLLLKGRARKVVESGQHHATEKIIPQDSDSILYTATVSSIEEIGRWVLGFGGEAEIVEPPKLREWVCCQAAAALAANAAGGE